VRGIPPSGATGWSGNTRTIFDKFYFQGTMITGARLTVTGSELLHQGTVTTWGEVPATTVGALRATQTARVTRIGRTMTTAPGSGRAVLTATHDIVNWSLSPRVRERQVWRRLRDLNPGWGVTPNRISRQA